MTRPPLTIALSSVLAAAIDGAGRPGLLATLHPNFGRPVVRQSEADLPEASELAQVIILPRVIPMPRRDSGLFPNQPNQLNHPEQPAADPDPDPSAA